MCVSTHSCLWECGFPDLLMLSVRQENTHFKLLKGFDQRPTASRQESSTTTVELDSPGLLLN